MTGDEMLRILGFVNCGGEQYVVYMKKENRPKVEEVDRHIIEFDTLNQTWSYSLKTSHYDDVQFYNLETKTPEIDEKLTEAILEVIKEIKLFKKGENQ